MRARWASAVVGTTIVAMLLPAGTAVGTGLPAGADLGTAREALGGATRELAEVEAAVRRTNDEVAALDDRLLSATTVLEQVRDELSAAEAARDAALADERTTATALAEVAAALDATLAERRAYRERLQERAIRAFKHGSSGSQDLLVRGIVGAGDWHAVAVTLEVVGRLASDDLELVTGSEDLVRSEAELRARVGAARAEALRAARSAREEERRVAGLVDQQASLVADITSERDQRAVVLARFEADAAARAVLVRDLERRIAELELAAATVLVPIAVDLDVHGPPPAWADRLPAGGAAYGAAIEATAARYGLDGRLLAALVWTESNFRPDAVSSAGALGLAQLMPGTARGLGVDPRDPLQNLDGGARYLRAQLDRFGSVDLALAAYNAGPNRVVRAGNRVPDIAETQLYVVRVLERYRRLVA